MTGVWNESLWWKLKKTFQMVHNAPKLEKSTIGNVCKIG